MVKNLFLNRKSFQTLVFLGVFISAYTSNTFAADYKKSSQSKVGFVAHTTMFDANGLFHDWDIHTNLDTKDLTKSSVEVRIKTKSIDTDIEKRDEHLRKDDFFHTDKYPLAIFKSTHIKVVSKNWLEIKGKLTIKNITKEVIFKGKYNWFEKANGRAIRIQGGTQVIRQDFNINYKSGLFLPAVKKNVEINFDITLIPTAKI